MLILLLAPGPQLSADRKVFPNCLHGSTPNTPQTSDPSCSTDVLGFSKNAEVRAAKTLLHLDQADIIFAACTAFPYTTSMPKLTVPYRFEIDYPLTDPKNLEAHIPAIFHELGHVYQLQRAGSPSNLDKELDNSIERAELGADFIAGLIAQARNVDPGTFGDNLFLPGNYRVNDHGRQEDRAAAYRNGYFYPLGRTTLARAYQDFQDNRYAQIQNSKGSE
jgi:hypothetical protein